MMRIPCTIAAVFLLALLAGQACADVERQQEENLVPIAFSAVVSGDMPLTRAAHEIGDDATLQANGFGVFACYTGLHKYSESDANASFMYDQKVEWSAANSHWVYEPLKYWPNGEGEATSVTGENPHYVSFFAYAPYSDGSNPCIPSFSRFGEQTNAWLMYRLAENVEDQVDLLYADPLLDCTKPAVDEKLCFVFKHALACVGEDVKLDCSDALVSSLKAEIDAGGGDQIDYYLKSMKIKYVLTGKGRMTLWNKGTANWAPIQSEDVLVTRSVILFSGQTAFFHYKSGDSSVTVTPWTDHGHGVFCIPAEAPGYPQKAVVEMEYKIRRVKGSEIIEADRSVSSELLLKGFIQEGKTLDINITLSN